MASLKVVSFNARGLGNELKRKKTFRFLKTKKAQFYFIQETHCVQNKEFIWQSQWGNKCFFANGTSNTTGVAILCSGKYGSIEQVQRDINGRFIIIKVKINDHSVALVNLYAPNEDSQEFFEQIFNCVENLNATKVVIGGDFNVVINPEKDRNKNVIYNSRAREFLLSKVSDNTEEIDGNEYLDIWRIKNPSEKKFTWSKFDRRRNEFMWSRIDLFLISGNVLNQVEECEIQPSFNSDHSVITLKINLDSRKRGPGVWRMNSKHLQDEEFCNLIKGVIRNTDFSFSHLPIDELWDLTKFEVTRYMKDYARLQASKERNYKFTLYKILQDTQTELIESPHQRELTNNLSNVKAELNAIIEEETKKAAFRCRAKFLAEGEKNSAYFFNLEKRNYQCKTMTMLMKENGQLTYKIKKFCKNNVNSIKNFIRRIQRYISK